MDAPQENNPVKQKLDFLEFLGKAMNNISFPESGIFQKIPHPLKNLAVVLPQKVSLMKVCSSEPLASLRMKPGEFVKKM